MPMKYTVIAASLLLASGAAAAEPPYPTLNLGQDWQAKASAERHVAEDLQNFIQAYQALKAENAKLKADIPTTPAAK